MINRSYYKLEIAISSNNYEDIYNTLYLSGITSIVEENGVVEVCLDESELSLLEQIKQKLIETNTARPSDISLVKFDDKDWNSEWEKTIEPVYIEDRIVVYPSWKKDELDSRKADIAIQIDPKMSFGTGHNETTQLILADMCKHINPAVDKTIMDFGCGTAILSIAAIKLGMLSALAIDIDEDSIANAAECISVNRVEDNVKLLKADLSDIDETGFNVIAANITSNVILPNLQLMHSKLIPGGKLFVTGILAEENDMLSTELTKNSFETITISHKGEWVSAFALAK